MTLPVGRRIQVTPQNYSVTIDGDKRPAYSFACPKDGPRRHLVPQRANVAVGNDKRALYAMADCEDGESLIGKRVKVVPQGFKHTIGTDTRPVYAFACCPGGSSSSSSSSSSPSGIPTPCCPSVPTILHVDISNSGCTGIDGTYQIYYQGCSVTDLHSPCYDAPAAYIWCAGDNQTFGICLACGGTGTWSIAIWNTGQGFGLCISNIIPTDSCAPFVLSGTFSPRCCGGAGSTTIAVTE